ncbi:MULTISPECIES: hypothetical protein [Pseudomonas]|uniref:Lipoprotein n=1 Tax=Pseudomonas quercus TaxID=2722792 RepID=A0ABX0YKW7_9PSED|nr:MULTISPECIES: hypothetical protein [Pseudomonas]MBF7144966.1 hypothetical protein [Pseudomonas sp. LY10J]NJP03557.1 hypothetical protein [Pseudomonas quercus]
MQIKEVAQAAFIVSGALMLAACARGPSEGEIQAALQPELEGASCVRAPMFKTFPVTLKEGFGSGTSIGNEPSFDALVSAGLLAKSGNTYSLTEPGRNAYVQQESGFCYAQGYEIANIKDTSENTEKMGPAVDKSWVVLVDIRQKSVAAWAKTPEIQKLARNPETLSEEPKSYRVVVGRLKAEKTLQLIDPSFSIMRGLSVNQAF